MEQPTKEEVGELKARLGKNGVDGLLNLEVLDLIEAYLALREEVKEEEDRLRSGFQRTIDDLSRTIDLLQADNEALRARLEKMKESREREIQDAINDYRGGQHGY